MILGGIDPGVTPLEMAYAYSTISRDGLRIGGELDSIPGPNKTLEDLGPVAIREVVKPDGSTLDGGKDEDLKTLRAIPENVADDHQGHPAPERALGHRREGADRQLRVGQDGHHRQQR